MRILRLYCGPQRHQMVAVAHDPAETTLEEALAQMYSLIGRLTLIGAMGHYCEGCGSPASAWFCEVEEKPFMTHEEMDAYMERQEGRKFSEEGMEQLEKWAVAELRAPRN